MIKPGLVSVTFRSLGAREVITLAKQAGLSAVEWGGDIHVPHGDLQKAGQVREMTMSEGMEIAGYGSYYRTGEAESLQNPAFSDVLKSARALGAHVIRVWAGASGSSEADANYRLKVIKDSRRIAQMAASEGIDIAFEYHGGTLTDEKQSAKMLMEALDNFNCKCYWQPACNISENEVGDGLRMILLWLSNVHVFHWVGNNERRKLMEGYDKWLNYLDIIAEANGDRYAMLEFVKNDDPNVFLEDAQVLINILQQINIH